MTSVNNFDAFRLDHRSCNGVLREGVMRRSKVLRAKRQVLEELDRLLATREPGPGLPVKRGG